MARQRIAEVNYYEFMANLRRATDAGGRIEPTDREKWAAYIKSKNVNEVAFLHLAGKKYSNVKGVIIDQGGDWDGFYAYSVDDEACLKWEQEGD